MLQIFKFKYLYTLLYLKTLYIEQILKSSVTYYKIFNISQTFLSRYHLNYALIIISHGHNCRYLRLIKKKDYFFQANMQ